MIDGGCHEPDSARLVLPFFCFGISKVALTGGVGTTEGVECDDTFNLESVCRGVSRLAFCNNTGPRKNYIRVNNRFAIYFVFVGRLVGSMMKRYEHWQL